MIQTELPFLVRKESYRGGMKRTIYPSAIAAGETTQYSETNADIKVILGPHPHMNFFTIINNDVVDIQLSLDLSDKKLYIVPKGASVGADNVMFRMFNVKNLDASTSTTANKILVVVGYEPSLEETEKAQYGVILRKKGWIVK